MADRLSACDLHDPPDKTVSTILATYIPNHCMPRLSRPASDLDDVLRGALQYVREIAHPKSRPGFRSSLDATVRVYICQSLASIIPAGFFDE